MLPVSTARMCSGAETMRQKIAERFKIVMGFAGFEFFGAFLCSLWVYWYC